MIHTYMMHRYMYVSIDVCMQSQLIHTYIHIDSYIYTYTDTYSADRNLRRYASIHSAMYTHTYIYSHTNTHKHTHTHKHTRTHTHTRIHTHIHTHNMHACKTIYGS